MCYAFGIECADRRNVCWRYTSMPREVLELRECAKAKLARDLGLRFQ